MQALLPGLSAMSSFIIDLLWCMMRDENNFSVWLLNIFIWGLHFVICFNTFNCGKYSTQGSEYAKLINTHNSIKKLFLIN